LLHAFAGVVPTFAAWAATYGKVYNGEEAVTREAIYDANVAKMQEHNAQAPSWIMDVNGFSDLTAEEFKENFLGYTPRKSKSDVHLGQHQWTGEPLPDSVDWFAAGAVTPVKNQGQCGSCWAFSTTGSLEGAFKLATGNLISIAEQQLVDCAPFPDMGCNGGSMDFGLRFAKTHDFCLEDSYPYEAQKKTCRSSGCNVGIHKGQVTGVKDLAVIPELVPASQAAMQSAVAQQPVSIAVDASSLQSYSSGIIGDDCGTKLDHGVLAVGYGTLNGQKYWKVKNSWTSTWGMDGFFLLKRGGGGKGTCGMLLDPVYPVISGSAVSV